MDAITLRITSGSRDWQQYYGSGTGIFIMAQNVRPGRFDPSTRQPVNPPVDDPSCERSRVEENDLLVTIVGANTGDMCRVPEVLEEHYVCQSVALMRPVEKTIARYLEWYFNAQNGGQLHYRRYIYGAGRSHLSFDQLKMAPVVIPPLSEQEAIVEAVEDEFSIIDHLEADLDAKLRSAQALRQSILRHAFVGRLVPQDPKDEPASELLKRIEREARAREIVAAKRATREVNGARLRRVVKQKQQEQVE
jgi:type I restriction enzyme S subunit